jgi:MSHA biogenesis protein MshK
MRRGATPLALLLAASTVHAAPFADPFRPPREVAPSTASSDAAAAGGPRLESVLIAPDRRIAVINGQQYTEGASLGDARILRISESEVVLRRAGRDEVLKLYPQDIKRAGVTGNEGK